jgi:hypothetical protein
MTSFPIKKKLAYTVNGVLQMHILTPISFVREPYNLIMISVIVWVGVEVCEGWAMVVARFDVSIRDVVSVRVGAWELHT